MAHKKNAHHPCRETMLTCTPMISLTSIGFMTHLQPASLALPLLVVCQVIYPWETGEKLILSY